MGTILVSVHSSIFFSVGVFADREFIYVSMLNIVTLWLKKLFLLSFLASTYTRNMAILSLGVTQWSKRDIILLLHFLGTFYIFYLTFFKPVSLNLLLMETNLPTRQYYCLTHRQSQRKRTHSHKCTRHCCTPR